jgi:hypothetical protein
MGAWGPGLQANDTALDAISIANLDEGMGDRSPVEVVDSLRERGEEWLDAPSVLGVADRMLDMGQDLWHLEEGLRAHVRNELDPEVLARWQDPRDRVVALRNFLLRLEGKEMDLEVGLDNAGLFARRGRSNLEVLREAGEKVGLEVEVEKTLEDLVRETLALLEP